MSPKQLEAQGWEFYSHYPWFVEDLDQICRLIGSTLYESMYVDQCWYVRRIQD